MTVFRISRSKYIKDLSGEGARLSGGRWNHKGIPCVYASESKALAVLEYTVNVNIDDIPRALSIATIEIPDSSILSVSIADLPGNWNEHPSPGETKDFGTQLLLAAKYSVIKIPSTVISSEYNYILNPLHRDGKLFKITETKDFIYDLRIKKA